MGPIQVTQWIHASVMGPIQVTQWIHASVMGPIQVSQSVDPHFCDKAIYLFGLYSCLGSKSPVLGRNYLSNFLAMKFQLLRQNDEVYCCFSEKICARNSLEYVLK
jgi:hypothetical protein